jgi:hypothetical protein
MEKTRGFKFGDRVSPKQMPEDIEDKLGLTIEQKKLLF